MKLPAFAFPHRIQVERLSGQGALGPVFADATTEAAFVEDKNRLVRDSRGDQVVSSTTVYLPPDVASIPLSSRVTVNGRERKAIAVQVLDAGGLPLPAHVVVSLE